MDMVVMMTLDDLRQLFREVQTEVQTEKEATTAKQQMAGRRYVYGIAGIAGLLGVSVPTAQRYKDSWLAPAVMQQGRKVITDAETALNLFRNYKEDQTTTQSTTL